MAGSGLQELLDVVFAGNAIRYMLTGKTTSRAVYGHMLIGAALITTPVAPACHISLPSMNTGHSMY